MASQLDIYNMALDATGCRSTVSSPEELSPEAEALNRHYDTARTVILSAFNWSFARQQMQLAVLLDATQGQIVPTPWVYEYSCPANLLKLRSILPVSQITNGYLPNSVSYGPPVKFLTSSDVDPISGNDINVILTNQAQAIAIYTKDVTNTQLFPAQFVEALRLYLGHRIAIPLTGDKTIAKMLYDEAGAVIRTAEVVDANQGLTMIDTVPDWLACRGIGRDEFNGSVEGFSFTTIPMGS